MAAFEDIYEEMYQHLTENPREATFESLRAAYEQARRNAYGRYRQEHTATANTEIYQQEQLTRLQEYERMMQEEELRRRLSINPTLTTTGTTTVGDSTCRTEPYQYISGTYFYPDNPPVTRSSFIQSTQFIEFIMRVRDLFVICTQPTGLTSKQFSLFSEEMCLKFRGRSERMAVTSAFEREFSAQFDVSDRKFGDLLERLSPVIIGVVFALLVFALLCGLAILSSTAK